MTKIQTLTYSLFKSMTRLVHGTYIEISTHTIYNHKSSVSGKFYKFRKSSQEEESQFVRMDPLKFHWEIVIVIYIFLSVLLTLVVCHFKYHGQQAPAI